MAKTALVPIAEGTEEIEAACIIDILRRANVEVVVASVGGLQVKASRGLKIVADKLIKDCVNDEFDLIVLPGGAHGAENLSDSVELKNMLHAQVDAGRMYAAICASPAVVLGHHGLLDRRRATAYPSYQHALPVQSDVKTRVVVDGNCVTSQGPGTAIEFALVLVKLLAGEAKMIEIRNDLIVD